jgi:transposase
VICDHAAFHKSRSVQPSLEGWGYRIELHSLPTHTPETTPIERVWWHLHETITRNHPCTTIAELLRELSDWIGLLPIF